MSNDNARPLQARAVRTRARLLEAAAQEFSERGYASATSKSIAERAGVATGSFYQYFSNKDLALQEIAKERFARVQEQASGVLPRVASKDGTAEITTALRAAVGLVIALHREDPGLHAVLTERRHLDPALDQVTSGFERSLVARICEWLETWGSPGDRQATAFVLFCSLEGAVHSHVLGHPVVSDERFVNALVAALTRIIGLP